MDEDEYYKNFISATNNEEDLPSDDEDFFAVDEVIEDNYHARIPKAELVDLVMESQHISKPTCTVYRPVMPVYNQRVMDNVVCFTREQRMMLLSQIEIFIQLLIQNILLADDIRMKEDGVRILRDVLKRCESNSNLYDISFLINGRAKISVPRQISLLYVPLVDVIKTCFPFEDLMRVRMSRKEIKDALEIFSPPFISRWLLPLDNIPSPRKAKQGFNVLDDMLLLQGLTKTSSLFLIQENWLPNKTPAQIKNRIKNLKSKKYPPKNEAQERIMKLLEEQKKPLNEEELQQLRKGLQWFGLQKIHQIQKYFLPNRPIKLLTEMSREQISNPLDNFTQENLDPTDSCACFCQCDEVFEVYYLQ
ncbi:unnamed protein product [Blepharisma stoltei]|uniref:Uncharacterized protein n=1 Tax=Blepharisma stoltei TaxID=1481888 RepID=A0AAU9K1X0_9CILI|nr:unnamed protein product [Blepharisma stoltei]